jgi:hypothetical protein
MHSLNLPEGRGVYRGDIYREQFPQGGRSLFLIVINQ